MPTNENAFECVRSETIIASKLKHGFFYQFYQVHGSKLQYKLYNTLYVYGIFPFKKSAYIYISNFNIIEKQFSVYMSMCTMGYSYKTTTNQI